MNPIENFFWMAIQAIAAVPVLHPVGSILAFLGLAVAIAIAVLDRKRWSEQSAWPILIPFAIPLLILLFGVGFEYRGPPGSAHMWRSVVINVLIWAHVPYAVVVFAVCRFNGLVVLGLSGFQLWLSFCAGFMSWMSVNNVWL